MSKTPAVTVNWFNASSHDGSSCLDVRTFDDGTVQTRNSNRPDTTVVSYDATEWSAFIAGVKAGKFDHTV